MGSYKQLKQIKNITLLFIISMVLGFATVILYFATQDKKENINKQIELKKTQLDLTFTKKVFELQKKYNSKLEEFIGDEDILNAFASRDRKKLDKLAQIKFDKLIKDEPNFELICFGLPDMTAFYRAHVPNKYGDDISKVQGVLQANKLKKRVSGFLITKLGLFYRVTFPVFKNGKHIGIIAFGINLGYVNDFIEKQFNTESAIIVNTKQLKQSKWFNMLEEGTIGSYTIISTNGELINQFSASGHNIDAQNVRMEDENKIFSIINDIEIFGIKNKPIAKVILFQDITKEVKIYENYLYTFIGILVILIIILSYALIMTFNKFLTTIVSINDDLKDLNIHLEDRVFKEVQKNREKEQQLFEQSKRAQIGEMIGNIAHQWRQPLSVISTSISGMQLQKTMGILDDNEFNNTSQKIMDTTQYLSKIIDEFRDFIDSKNEFSDFILQDAMDKTLRVNGATLQSNHIKLIKRYKETPIHIHSIQGEISQVVLNIINNAKDILCEREIENKEITVSITTNNNYAIIMIEDNAGGIEEDILPKIFDPYFTTRHQSQGKGIGLYMCNTIVTQNLKGEINATNGTKGALFSIEIPIK
ncbi:MAG: GHKL domain-containing protein [Arcobacteraceae bacterium]|nr:GHKL domain-containing protein [Arcobacteraceae bacterium]